VGGLLTFIKENIWNISKCDALYNEGIMFAEDVWRLEENKTIETYSNCTVVAAMRVRIFLRFSYEHASLMDVI
jgi:hypothetical protein